MYKEFAPDLLLRSFIECYWINTPQMELPYSQRILPDGCADIILRLEGSKCFFDVIGTQTVYSDVVIDNTGLFVGIRFHPGGMYPFLKVPMYEVTDQDLPLADISKKVFNAVENMPGFFDDLPQLIRQLDRLFIGKLRRENYPADKSLDQAVNLLQVNKGIISIKELAYQSNISLRQLERKFQVNIGVSPKLLASVIRFRHTHKQIRRFSNRSISEIAWDNGYFDHSHLYQDFMRFSGKSPEALR